MKLLISAVTFDSYLRAGMCQLELVPMADKHNLAGVEFRPYWRSPVEELPEIKEFLDEYGLACTYASNETLLGISPSEVHASLASMLNSLTFAERVGTRLLRINVASGPFDRTMVGQVWWREAVAAVIACAAERNIILALENAPDPDSGDPALIRDILAIIDSPWLKATFDTGNWMVAGYDVYQALDMLMPYIIYVHLKDVKAHPTGYIFTHLGNGSVDILGLVKALKQRSYAGYFALEFPGGSSPAKRIQSSIQYLNWE